MSQYGANVGKINNESLTQFNISLKCYTICSIKSFCVMHFISNYDYTSPSFSTHLSKRSRTTLTKVQKTRFVYDTVYYPT